MKKSEIRDFKVGVASCWGKDWMFDKWVDIDNEGKNLEKGKSFSDFKKALKQDPSFPTFKTKEETEAAYKGAWDEYVSIIEDKKKVEERIRETFTPNKEKEGD